MICISLLAAALLAFAATTAQAIAPPPFGIESKGFSNSFADPPFSEEGIETFSEGGKPVKLSEPFLDRGGVPLTQAGGHPFAMTTQIVFNHKVEKEAVEDPGEEPEEELPTETLISSSPRNLTENLPAGVVVDPEAPRERCTEEELENEGDCPPGSAVGVAVAYLEGAPYRVPAALFDMVAPKTVPAQFGANFAGLGYEIHVDGKLRRISASEGGASDGGYALSGEVSSILDTFPIYAITATFWGDPSTAVHNSERGECGAAPPSEKKHYQGNCPLAPSEVSETPFLSMPGSCTAQPLVSSIGVESWETDLSDKSAESPSPAVTGCGALDFKPSIEAQPETSAAGSATGLTFDLHVPQAPPEYRPGSTVDCSQGSWQNNPTGFAYRWLRNGVPISGASASTYVITEADTGALLQCEVIAANTGVGPGFAVSAPLPVTTPLTSVTPTTTVASVVQMRVFATGGAFELKFGAEETAPIPFAATDAEVQSALDALPGIGGAGGSVTVTGGPGNELGTNQYVITATGSLSGKNLDLIAERGSLELPETVPGTPVPGKVELEHPIAHTVGVGGGTFDCEPGAWGGKPTFAYQWFKDGSPLAGQTAGSYVVAAGETPLTLQCEVIATDTSGAALAFSAGIESVPALTPALPNFTEAPRASYPVSDLALATANLKNATVTLPPGMTVNPSSADGLEGCPLLTKRADETAKEAGEKEVREQEGKERGIDLESNAPANCPDASKIGSVEVKTPLLEKPLPGSIYLAQPFANPFGDAEHPGGSLLALYLVVDDEERGIVVKLAGHVEVGGEEGGGAGLESGQIRATFANNPQLPFEDVKLTSEHSGLYRGPRAPLTTPPTCGTYTTTSDLVPWSAPEGADATPSDPFEVTQAPGGGPCAQTLAQEPNAPGFTAGTFTPIAGAYSPFVLHLSREDGSQSLRGLSVTLPPGMLGKIAGIEQCPQAGIEAAEHRGREGEGQIESEHPSCPSGSELGTATVGAGSGAPYYVKGKAYLAGAYEGAPFSVVVITPAIAKPFDLGTVVVRTGLYINPETAQVTATAKNGSIPTEVHGIPVDVRSLTIEMTRSQFTLNPTSCEKKTVTGTAFGESSPAVISAPFQVGGCTGLPFKPALSASAGGHGSKPGGTSLNIEVTSAGVGQANIQKLHIQFPKELSSRLTTLQKACTEKVFNANPASCDPDSMIGHAIVHTPLLSSPLIGPAILVSHGGAAFPDVEFVLQGEGVEVVVDAKTSIKSGITYSYIESAPDAPFTSFETEFPSGPDSVFTSNVPTSAKYSLCGQSLVMPIEMTGQNGAELKQNIKIAPTGCANALRVVSKKLGPAGKTLTLSVEVPAAGKLTASGRGLKSVSKTSTARQIVSLSISLTKADAAKIAKHKSVKVKVNLTFAPSSGKKLTSSFPATYKAKAAKKGAHKKK